MRASTVSFSQAQMDSVGRVWNTLSTGISLMRCKCSFSVGARGRNIEGERSICVWDGPTRPHRKSPVR